MFHKDYDRKGSVEKQISGRESQGTWRQDETASRKVTLTVTQPLEFSCCEKLVSEVGDRSGAQNKGISAVRSRYQVMASEGCNRMR
jgi:hypothetical protein